MSNEQLKHIFDDSVCLTRRQMKEYVGGTMTNEESYAVELHLNSCPFCSEAIEGLFEQKEGHAVEMLADLDTDFLKDHFSLQHPHIHLNSLAAPQPAAGHIHYNTPKRKNTQPLWRTLSVAAALLLGVSVFWYLKKGDTSRQPVIAEATTPAQPAPAEPPLKKREEPSIAANTLKAKETQEPTKAILSEEESVPPTSNGSGSQSPQTLLLADKPDDKAEMKDTVTPGITMKKEQEEMVAGSYSNRFVDRPTIKMAPAAPAPQIEKMPTRSVSDMAATSQNTYAPANTENLKLGGARAENMKYSIDGVTVKDADNLSKGEDLYKQKKYKEALNTYKKELNSDNKGRRQKASLMTARCYLALGQKTQATKVLEDLVQNGSGAPKREAKKMLDDLKGE
jgi:FimV-like protein